ncbi:hypothetical protein [Saccharibacillus sacchari]|uniref:Uncharacterized protein n=1 Tax=Saccharibacillus sacchari TaxID=456493 RepID=A0ACC6PHD9_9BACL
MSARADGIAVSANDIRPRIAGLSGRTADHHNEKIHIQRRVNA